MGVLAGFGHDTFITAQQIDIVGLEQMHPKEVPEDDCPGQHASEKALDGAITGSLASPAGDAEHGHTTGHGQHGQRDQVELTDGGHRDLRLKAQQEW